MKLIEGTHYRRRIGQPSPHLARSKEFVDCLICRLPSDSEEEEGRTTLRRSHVKDGIRLDKLPQHFKAKHKGHLPSEGMSLLDMGFTRGNATSTQLSEDAVMETEEEGGPSTSPPPMTEPRASVAARAMQPPPRQAAATPISTAIAEMGLIEGQPFWRVLSCGYSN
jgi:hypothetical protein